MKQLTLVGGIALAVAVGFFVGRFWAREGNATPYSDRAEREEVISP